MTQELSPPGKNARMTSAQVKKYIKDMKKAQAKIDEAQNSGEIEKEQKEIEELENLLEEK